MRTGDQWPAGGFSLASIARRRRGTGQGGRPALSYRERTWSYDDLADRVDRAREGLLRLGVGSGSRVCVLMNNSPEWLGLFFGLMSVGAVCVPVNYYYRAPELDSVLADSGAEWIATEDVFEDLLRACPRARDLGRLDVAGLLGDGPSGSLDPGGGVAAVGFPADAPDPDPDDVALLQYSSGTTGRMKAAVHTQTTILWNSVHQIAELGIDPESVTLLVPALCWSAGLHDLTLATLWAGGHVVVHPSRHLDPQDLLRTLEQRRVTHVFLVPSILRRFAEIPDPDRYDLSALQLVLTGGEPVLPELTEDLVRRFPGIPLAPSYGLSEFPSTMTHLTPRQLRGKPGSVGRPSLIAEVRIVDDADNEVPVGTVGELLCRSPATMKGYHGDPEESARALSGGWLRTGDLARVDVDGFYYVVGRKKDMLISGGLNVYPAEVERVLAEHPAILEIVVDGIPDDRWGTVPRAFVVLDPDCHASVAELVEFARSRLASYKVPREFVFRTDRFPRSAGGKVLRNRVR